MKQNLLCLLIRGHFKLKIRINKHAPDGWFTPHFHSTENCLKIAEFFENRFPGCKTHRSKFEEYFNGHQLTVWFNSEEDDAAFRFLWLANEGFIDIESI